MYYSRTYLHILYHFFFLFLSFFSMNKSHEIAKEIRSSHIPDSTFHVIPKNHEITILAQNPTIQILLISMRENMTMF